MRKFLFLLPLILAGCGSDGNDIGTPRRLEQQVPRIGNLILSPDIAAYMEGDGSISVTAQFNYAGSGRDISHMHVEISDGTSFNVSLAGFNTTEGGIFTEQFDISTATIGPRTVEIWLVAAEGDSSNRLTAEFEVLDMARTSEWTSRLSGLPYVLYDVVWDGQVFIAVGSGGAILTSVDGIDWVARESGTESYLWAVAASGPDIYAVGGSIVLLSTDHGETWSAKARPDYLALSAVAVNSSQVVVTGTLGDMLLSVIMTSEDRGDTWQESGFSWWVSDLIYRDGLFVAPAVGFFNVTGVIISTDGKSWNEIGVRDENTSLSVVVHDDSQFFVAGDDGRVFSSFDAYNWTELPTPLEDVSYQSAAWDGSRLVFAGGVSHRYWEDGIFRPIGISSTDGGASWDIFDIDGFYQSNGMAWGNGRFVSVGWTPASDEGAIYTTE